MSSGVILIVGIGIFGIFLIGAYVFLRIEFEKEYVKNEKSNM